MSALDMWTWWLRASLAFSLYITAGILLLAALLWVRRWANMSESREVTAEDRFEGGFVILFWPIALIVFAGRVIFGTFGYAVEQLYQRFR